MRNLILLLSVLLIACSCAVQAPILTEFYPPADNQDDIYQRRCNLIDISKLKVNDKAIAKQSIRDYITYSEAMNNFTKSNESVIKENERKNNNYSLVNSWVGGLGGLSSIATFWASWTVVVPIVSGVWNIYGLSVQSTNLKPELDKSKSNRKEIASVNEKYILAGEAFQKMVGSKDTTETYNNFQDWMQKINAANNDASRLFGVIGAKAD